MKKIILINIFLIALSQISLGQTVKKPNQERAIRGGVVDGIMDGHGFSLFIRFLNVC